jgi:hypothetical protein
MALKSKSVYVAGKYSDKEYIQYNQALIRENGLTISYDWTSRMKDGPRFSEDLGMDAKLDIEGVLNADWSIFLFTDKDYEYRGSFCELGVSITRDLQNDKRHTIIISPSGEVKAASCCFFYHPNIIHVNDIDEAIAIIKMEQLDEWKGF